MSYALHGNVAATHMDEAAGRFAICLLVVSRFSALKEKLGYDI